MTELRTSEVLHRAADLIEERGWTRGGWTSSGPLCLEGGILAAMGTTFDDIDLYEFWKCPTYLAVADYLQRDVTLVNARPLQPLWIWNDEQPAEGQQKVIQVLRAAAAVEAAREDALAADMIALMSAEVPIPLTAVV